MITLIVRNDSQCLIHDMTELMHSLGDKVSKANLTLGEIIDNDGNRYIGKVVRQDDEHCYNIRGFTADRLDARGIFSRQAEEEFYLIERRKR